MASVGNVYVFDSTNIPSEELGIVHRVGETDLEKECLGLCDDQLKTDIERRRAAYGSSDSGEFDGNLLSFDELERRQDGTRILTLHDMAFSTYQALRARLGREQGHEHTLTRLITMLSVVETSDSMFPMGHRSTNHMSGRYLPPAGFTNHSGLVDEGYFAHLAIQEIKEELGIVTNPGDVRYVGLTSGDDSRNTTVTLHVKLKENMETVQGEFAALNHRLRSGGERDKVEHEHLIFVPNDLDSMAGFLSGRYTGVLNPMQGIEFREGLCVRGPEEILGRRYEQIGNGIAGFLALMRERIKGEDYAALTSMIETAGVVDDVRHLDINSKLMSCAMV